MKAYTIERSFYGRARVALRERSGRGETIGHVVRHEGSTSKPGWSVEVAKGIDASVPGIFFTRAAAAAALFAATCELIEGDEGSVAVCDLCGQADDHSHTIEEYGFPTPDQIRDEEAQVLGEVN